MKTHWHDVRIPEHKAEKCYFGVEVDKRIFDEFMLASKKYGWGGKRRLAEAALLDLLRNTNFEFEKEV
jgi:hypothetical protein